MIGQHVILVGEAPGPGYDPDKASPLYPFPANSAGGRLCKMTGLWREEYIRTTDRINLVPAYPGKTWPKERARAYAVMLCRGGILRDRTVVLVGAKVRDAFFEASRVPWLKWMRRGDADMICIPHPSGKNLYYNDPENKALVEDMFRKLFERGGAPT